MMTSWSGKIVVAARRNAIPTKGRSSGASDPGIVLCAIYPLNFGKV